MAKPDDVFLEALHNSREPVWKVAEWLHLRGYQARILPANSRPDFEHRMDFADAGDIEIIQRVEVKHRPELDFKSLDDLPYSNIIVDEKYKIDKYHPATLYGYLILNASKTGAIPIPAFTTRRYWFADTKYDSKEKAEREYIFCPKQYLTYVELCL